MSVNLDPRPGDPFPLTTHLLQKITELERENAALRADKERLDWLGKVKCAYYHEGPCCWRINEDESTDGETIRAAIDAARKANDE
jgi:hypothetical protein